MSPAVIPSTEPDEYDKPRPGESPLSPGTSGSGYEYWNEPDCNPTDHDPATVVGVAANVPCGLDDPAITTNPPPDPAASPAGEGVASVASDSGTDDEDDGETEDKVASGVDSLVLELEPLGCSDGTVAAASGLAST